MAGWNTSFVLGWPIFRGYVSFRESISILNYMRMSHMYILPNLDDCVSNTPWQNHYPRSLVHQSATTPAHHPPICSQISGRPKRQWVAEPRKMLPRSTSKRDPTVDLHPQQMSRWLMTNNIPISIALYQTLFHLWIVFEEGRLLF